MVLLSVENGRRKEVNAVPNGKRLGDGNGSGPGQVRGAGKRG
jgi:hypothetical protein